MRQHFRTSLAAPALVSYLCMSLGAVPILGAPAPESAIQVSLQAEDGEGVRSQLVLERGAYEIEIYGATALVALVQEFSNPGEEEVTAQYGWKAEERHQPEFVTVEIAGAIRPLRLESQAQPASTTPPRRNTVVRGSLSHLRAEPADPESGRKPMQVLGEIFTVEGEPSVWIRTAFRERLTVDHGTLRLTLPPLREETTPERPTPLPVSVTVNIHAPLLEPTSPSHDVLVAHEGDRTIVELVRSEGLEDRPFVLEFAVVEEDEANFASFVEAETDGRRRVTATFTAPAAPRDDSVRPKQVLFILDTSGSMRDGKLDQAREALLSCLEKLQRDDRFNVMEFDTKYRLLGPQPLEASDADRRKAAKWLEALAPGGGTILLPALNATMEQPGDPDRHRMILLITDGKLADEAKVLELLEEKLDQGRLFVVGIGPSPNRAAILRLADYGRGAATFAGGENELQAAVVDLFDAISQPLAWDLHFDWGSAEVEEISPSRLPDLYANRPVKVLAWVRGELPSELRLRVTTMAGERDYAVSLPPRIQP